MQLFSEIYNCYYNIINDLLKYDDKFTKTELENAIAKDGFGETALYLEPKITTGEWSFFEKDKDLYVSLFDSEQPVILSLLQKRWLKSILYDARIRLFFTDEQLENLKSNLSDIEPLYKQEDFYIYDNFSDGDNYMDDTYRTNFQTILKAIKERQLLDITFQSHTKNRVHYHFLPCKLEYSIRNNCFRLLAIEGRSKSKDRFYTINLSRISELKETGKYIPADNYNSSSDNVNYKNEKNKASSNYTDFNIDTYITKEYHKEPVTLIIKNERNALERAMLQFANYKKNTTRIDDSTYRCEIFYNKSNETELLIEILSFGPAIRVVGNEHFLKLLKKRIKLQKELPDI
ncbi:MAG: WYL domain-containing protein [Lachnospiraceae bacterium]|nr:WYL domain-containing protein [Lachnospiraceae bacterium]